MKTHGHMFRSAIYWAILTALLTAGLSVARGVYAVAGAVPDFKEIIFRLKCEAVEAHPRC
jgi:hypothetical protein